MPGAGKTCAGQRAAELLQREFSDSDECIERAHGNISALFSAAGENQFRALERETLSLLSSRDGLVIATGGGAVLDKENVSRLKSGGRLFYLRASGKTLVSRLLGKKGRPLLAGAEDGAALRKKIEALLFVRSELYEAAADEVLDTDALTVEEVAREISTRFQKELR